jgi:hypothetical protein
VVPSCCDHYRRVHNGADALTYRRAEKRSVVEAHVLVAVGRRIREMFGLDVVSAETGARSVAPVLILRMCADRATSAENAVATLPAVGEAADTIDHDLLVVGPLTRLAIV